MRQNRKVLGNVLDIPKPENIKKKKSPGLGIWLSGRALV